VLRLGSSPTYLMAGRLLDDTTAVRSYNAQILQKIKNLYAKKKIDHYEYSHFINVLSCNELKIEDMMEKINHIIDGTEHRSSAIDMKI
jgi:hypothetical protein